jgi:hypothetical protein
MEARSTWFLVPGPHVIICPDCQQPVGQGAEHHHAKTCLKSNGKKHERYLQCLTSQESNSH